MAAPRSAIAMWSQYAGLRALFGLMHCFDIEQNLNTAASVGSLFYRCSHRHRERAITNLARSFPDWSPERVANVAERSMQHMFKLFMVDAVVLPRVVTATSWPHYAHLGPLRGGLDRLIRKQPMILIAAHCGNWEFLGYALSVIGYPVHALARPLDNPLLNQWVLGLRESRGMRIITKWGATPVLEDILRQNGQVAFIADQNAGDGGLFVPFFGRFASSYKSIGLLAMRYEIPITIGFARRIGGRFKYEISATDSIVPEDWADQPDPLYYITARYNFAIENMIRSAPEQYLWVHRRWKSRPRHERLGHPIPARLVDKVRSLPWMTPDQVDRIVEDSKRTARESAS